MTGLSPPGPIAYAGQIATPYIQRNFDPTTSDHNFNVPTIWSNPLAKTVWVLVAKPLGVADWIQFAGGSGVVEELQGNDGIPVAPSGAILQLLGEVVANGTFSQAIWVSAGGGNIEDVSLQLTVAIASSDISAVGVAAFDSSIFTVDANGFVSASGTGLGQTITGQSGGPLSPVAGNWNIFGAAVAAGSTPVATSGTGDTVTTDVQTSQAIASTDATKIGLAAFNSAQFSVDANGFVSSLERAFTYTNVDFADSPYTVLVTDDYISVDSSGGAVSLLFPDAPTTLKTWIVKDRTGNSSTNNISVTTVSGTVTIDGSTTYKLVGNWGAVELLFNGTNYEVF